MENGERNRREKREGGKKDSIGCMRMSRGYGKKRKGEQKTVGEEGKKCRRKKRCRSRQSRKLKKGNIQERKRQERSVWKGKIKKGMEPTEKIFA